jgi:hypothetical protein
MKIIFDFIVRSSADPQAISSTIKYALLGAIPFLMQALDIVCQFGYQCVAFDPSLLEVFFDAIASGIFYLLTLVSVAGTTWAAGRKIYRTATGQNKALQQ